MTVKEDIKDEEKKAINELRKRMKDEIDKEKLQDNIYLFRRFLIARDFNVDNAEIMLRKHLVWREKYDVKNIFNVKKPEIFQKYLSYTPLGYDKEGCIIRYCPAGNLDFVGIIASCTFQDIVNEIIYELETDTKELKEQSEKFERNIDKCVCIIDLKNLSFAKVTDKKIVHYLLVLLNVYLNNYPERLKTAFFINVPVYFSLLYSLLKTVLPTRVINKFSIYSDDSYIKDVLKLIDADTLPAFLGGNRTDPDGNPMCPSFIYHGGESVPEKYFIHRSKRTLSKLPGVQRVTLSRAAFHEVNLDVKESGSYLEWEFETKSRDIGFGLFFNEVIDDEEKITEMVPIQRIDTEEYPETGTLKCEKPGTYVIVFDNTYSWIRAKEIYYRAKIVSPKEHEAEMNESKK